MKQVTKHFIKTCLCDEDVQYQLNSYLEKHPNFRVSQMSFNRQQGTCVEDLFVVFDVVETENKPFKNVSKCQQNEDVLFDIGDTAYCVNGYGSQRYIEEFTVAEIRITKDGIWLTDTKGMEWLARVCHFSRDSAEKELKAQQGLIDIVNENFDKEDIIIHLTYEHDKTPQSEEVRKDIENYIRRLKEQRKNS